MAFANYSHERSCCCRISSPTKYIILIKKNTRPQEMFQEDRERVGSNEAEGYRGFTQHGGPSGWLEEGDPEGVILYVMDGPTACLSSTDRSCPAAS
jgi:hypothetical protein